MQRIIQAKTVYIATCTRGYDLGVIVGDCDILDVIGEGEEMEGLVVDGVVYEDVLFLVYGQEVTAVAVFYYLAVWDLDLF